MKKIISIAMAMVLCFMLLGCSTTEVQPETSEKEESLNIYDDENISIEFIKITNSLVAGNFELYIKAQNKTDKAVTVYLKDVCINGSMVQVGSGVPCDLIAGANRTHSFFGRLDLAGVASVDEIKTLTFKVWLVDENFNDLEVVK